MEKIKNILLIRQAKSAHAPTWNEAVKLLPEEAPEPMVSGIIKRLTDDKNISGLRDKSWKLVKKILSKMGYVRAEQKTENILRLIPAVEIGESGESVTLQDVMNVIGPTSFDIAS